MAVVEGHLLRHIVGRQPVLDLHVRLNILINQEVNIGGTGLDAGHGQQRLDLRAKQLRPFDGILLGECQGQGVSHRQIDLKLIHMLPSNDNQAVPLQHFNLNPLTGRSHKACTHRPALLDDF